MSDAARSATHLPAEDALFLRLSRDGDPAAREALVRRYLPLSRRIAWGFRGNAELDDLRQVAAVGLVKAINRFDPARGPAFSTYAIPTIVGELKRHFRDRGWAVRVPRDLQELAVRLERLTGELAGQLGRAPTVRELAASAGRSEERVLEALNAATARFTVSLDQPRDRLDEREATGREIAVEDPGYGRVDDSSMLDELLSRLSPRDRRIVELRFRDDRLQRQIAEEEGVSQMHVSRVIRSAIEQLSAARDDFRELIPRI